MKSICAKFHLNDFNECNYFLSIISEYENSVLAESNNAVVDVTTQDIQSYFIMLAKTILVHLNSEYLAGASLGRFANDTIIAWFNGQPHHSAPLAMNLVHNAIVRAMLGADHSIRLINEPLPFTTGSRIEMLSTGSNMGFQLATNVGFAMAFVSAFYIIFYIKVNHSRKYLVFKINMNRF